MAVRLSDCRAALCGTNQTLLAEIRICRLFKRLTLNADGGFVNLFPCPRPLSREAVFCLDSWNDGDGGEKNRCRELIPKIKLTCKMKFVR
ncbi:hypothetical protein DESC_120066 [Desulfosarcina cetonica]|nr:hypothetical protein DESC_120066 [Desulfosarcina cetonica]